MARAPKAFCQTWARKNKKKDGVGICFPHFIFVSKRLLFINPGVTSDSHISIRKTQPTIHTTGGTYHLGDHWGALQSVAFEGGACHPAIKGFQMAEI